MSNYLVFMPEDNERVEHEFPHANYRIESGLWAIRSDLPTCAEVCERLGIEDGNTMVVVPMNEYYGRFDRALWQRLDSWSKA